MRTIRSGNKPIIIHVNRQHIAMNAKDGGQRPVYTVKAALNETIYASEVSCDGTTKFVYSGKQLSCGARAWAEVIGEVTLTNPMSFKEARALGLLPNEAA